MAIDITNESTKWWSELRHGGILISPVLVEQYFHNINELENYKYNYLRDKYTSFEASRHNKEDVTQIETEVINRWIDYVLEVLLEHNINNISKGKNIDKKYKVRTIFGNLLQADRVIYSDESKENPVLLVSIQKVEKIGIGKGKKACSDFIDLLRETGVKVGLITNGVQFRICYAGIDYDAWSEWDASMWFIEAEWRKQLDGFIAILGQNGLSFDGETTKLKKAIEESRNKQSEISGILGQQIREAVESLINQLDSTLRTYPEILEVVNTSVDGTSKTDQQINSALYQAASRIVMRLVVLLFAEARILLPRDIAEYNQSYGIDGLFEQLKIALAYESKSRLSNQYSAWRRIISLFNLVHDGSGHSLINLQGYGGILFQTGDIESIDDVLQCISIFESEKFKLSDYQVYELLEKIKIGRLKTKQGSKTVWVKGPVDFSDLRTEYIGIMYEGLLDYSLKRATEPLIVLNIGSQPILPLSSLDDMSDKEIKDLVKNLRKDSKSDSKIEDISQEDEDDISDEESNENDNLLDDINKRAKGWALRVINVEESVKKKIGMDEYTYNKACEKEADKLVNKILHVGEYYIASQGGTRKGTGTFYTKPGLAVPTTRRTLNPLLYDTDSEGNEIPKKAKDILSIKICDPTCGSGAFLVAATDCITDALTKSILYYENYVTYRNTKTRVLPFGKSSKGNLDEELIAVTSEDPRFEEYLRSNLMRHVVERCIYGVDINPMAVELAKLALWINTMNTELPFTFLDHKIKVGNGLVGTWFSQFKHYPILAWNREGGDKEHVNGVHYKKGEWTNELKDFMNEKVKPNMVKFIEDLEHKSQLVLDLDDEDKEINTEIEDALKKSMEALDEFNELPMSASGIRAKEEVYKKKILNNPSLNTLKEAFDEWCAIWFWPADQLDEDVPMPTTFHKISKNTKDRVKRISNEIKFFHWELEFPDVFANGNRGFTAIIGNPPWDIAKPNSLEFFSGYNPIYRTYGKQDAIKAQTRLFENILVERTWIIENLNNKAFSNWISSVNNPYEITLVKGKRNKELLDIWSNSRNCIINMNDEVPFVLQGGGDPNKYKLFLEQAFYIIKRDGRLGMIVPSGLYSDNGTSYIRECFIKESNWEWLFSFENKKKIFDIHASFKFCIIILTKGRKTKYINSTFMRHDIEDLSNGEKFIFEYPMKLITDYSPLSKAFLEIYNKKDIEIINKIYQNGVLLSNSSGENWSISTKREFDMTNDSKFFINMYDFNGESLGYGRFKNVNGDILVPLYQGKMMGQFNFAASSWESGNGVNAKWRELKLDEREIYPQILIKVIDANNKISDSNKVKIFFRAIARNTDTRTMISTVAPSYPSGNSLTGIDINEGTTNDKLLLVNTINSFIFDYILRFKCGGSNLNAFILKEAPVLNKNKFGCNLFKILLNNYKLQLSNEVFAKEWIELYYEFPIIAEFNWYALWSITEHERLRLRCILDAVIAELYGLDYDDLAWILKDDQTDPKGFWRVDKDRPINMRHTTLTLVAFKRLKEVGIESFLEEEWQLPEAVAKAMGPRFLEWQLEKTPKQSWMECHEHARKFLGDKEYEKFINDLES